MDGYEHHHYVLVWLRHPICSCIGVAGIAMFLIGSIEESHLGTSKL